MSDGGEIKAFLVGNDGFISDLTTQLPRLGYGICGTSTVIKDALTQMTSSPAAIVLLDVSGNRTKKELVAIEHFRRRCHRPLILVSESSLPTTIAPLAAGNSIAHLLKPCDDWSLSATIQLTISRHHAPPGLSSAMERAFEPQCEAPLPSEPDDERLSAAVAQLVETRQKLQLAEERLFLALRASRQGLWEWNRETERVVFCPWFGECTGIPPEEIPIESSFRSRDVHPEDLLLVTQTIEQHLRGETEFSIVECRIKRTDGRFQWICAVAKILERDSEGSPVRVIGSISNIDKRKRAELKLRQFRQAVESANSGIILIDSKSQHHSITYVNPAFTRMTGYSGAEAIGQSHRLLACSETSDHEQDDVYNAISMGRTCHTVLRIRRKDGSFLWSEVNLAPVIDHNGGISHFFGILHDVTARKVAEDAVRSSRTKLSVTLDSISDAVLATDTDGRVTLMNRVAERLTGWPLPEAFGRPAKDVYRVWDSKGQLRTTFQLDHVQTQDEPPDSDGGHYLETRDGQRRPIADSAAPIRDPDGTILGIVLVFRDVTKERMATRQIRSLLNDLNDLKVALDEHSIVCIADANGKITYVNDRFCAVVKASRADLIGQYYAAIRSSYHSDTFFADLVTSVSNGNIWHGEICSRALDGSDFWADTTIVPFLEATGNPYQYVVVQSDITARKQAENRIRNDIAVRKQAEAILRRSNDELEKLVNDRTSKLRESEERLRIFVENVPAGVAMFDREMRYLAHSIRWQTDYRLGDRNLIGTSFYDGFPHLPEYHRQIHQRCLRGQIEVCEEDPVELADGSIEYFRWEIQPWRDSSGVVGGLVFFTERISEKRLAQLALQESEDRFRQIATSIDHIFWIYSLPEKTYLYVSPAYETIFGHSVSTLYANSKSWMDSVHPEDRPRFNRDVTKWMHNPTESEIEFRIVHSNSETRWICIRGVSIRKVGSRTRIAGVAEDITEKKLAESQSLQSQKLQAVGQLAGGIAHDFNNFILLISCYSEQLLAQLPDGDPNRKSIIAIRDAGARAAQLTNQLLAFSRKQVLEIFAVDLNELILRATQLMQGILRHDVIMNLELSSEVAAIDANPEQIDQVLLNLILNAQDAMPNGGRLTIGTSVELMPVNRVANGKHPAQQRSVRLTVADTGTGMNDEVKSRLFDPYFTTKPIGKGTGLGLAVVHGIVSQCGGSIHVESTLGVGTSLSLLFPASVNQVVPQPESLYDSEIVSGFETILLVEDDKNVRRLLKSALESHGYQVLDAAHGPSAIATAIRHEGPIHLLLTDVVMPEMSGGELALMLWNQFSNLPTIFMSGFADDGALLRDMRTHATSFLQKPFDQIVLLRKVREMLESAFGPACRYSHLRQSSASTARDDTTNNATDAPK